MHRSHDHPNNASSQLRVAIVADNCSEQFGGEAALPMQYFRALRRRGIEAFLITHARTRAEIDALVPHERDRILYVADTRVHQVLFRLGRLLPMRVNRCTFRFISAMLTQWLQSRLLRDLVRRRGINVAHQPVPVSPTEPSFIFDVGAAVVIGPMNGGMNYPPAFRPRENRAERAMVQAARRISNLANLIIPGKPRAQALLVSNTRTRELVPRCVRSPILQMHENGVDLRAWRRPIGAGTTSASRRQDEASSAPAPPVRFAFLGRLVDWKGVDLLFRAWAQARPHMNARLEIIGDGPCRDELQSLCRRLQLTDSVQFAGWLPRAECASRLAQCDALVLPSLMECGGAVVLEAMALGLPVIATRWGGPVDYLDDSCGILVSPDSVKGFIARLAAAMRRLHDEPELRQRMGLRARQKVVQQFDWEGKVDRMLRVYRYAVARAQATDHRTPLRLSLAVYEAPSPTLRVG